MNYKEKYNDALERARVLIEKLEDTHIKGFIYHIFPELKELKDEHKNWILEYLYDGLRRTDEQYKDEFKAAIAWLEKQDEQTELNDSEDESIRNALITLIKFGLEDGSAIAPGLNVTKEQVLAWLEKQK